LIYWWYEQAGGLYVSRYFVASDRIVDVAQPSGFDTRRFLGLALAGGRDRNRRQHPGKTLSEENDNLTARIYFDPEADGLGVFLGPTESRLMELMWIHGQVTVKQACLLLSAGPSAPTYSTVATILSRLAQRGLLRTEKPGRNFIYSPVQTKEEFLKSRVSQILACLSRNFPR
jgi:predicted transcriptional regulator